MIPKTFSVAFSDFASIIKYISRFFNYIILLPKLFSQKQLPMSLGL